MRVSSAPATRILLPACCLLIVSLSACGGGNDPKPNNTTPEHQAAEKRLNDKLLGRWQVDAEKVVALLQKRFAEMTENAPPKEQQDLAIQNARSSKMVFEFGQDGGATLTQSVGDGEPYVEQSTWEVINDGGDVIMIRVTKEGGAASEYEITFHDANSLTLKPNTGEQSADSMDLIRVQ